MRAQELCFTITERHPKTRKVIKLQPVWLNKRQLEALVLVHINKELAWQQNAKTHRELREKRLIVKLHKGSRCWTAACTEDGALLAKSILEAAKKKR